VPNTVQTFLITVLEVIQCQRLTVVQNFQEAMVSSICGIPWKRLPHRAAQELLQGHEVIGGGDSRARRAMEA
jgi:hypothetical protein